MRLVLLLCLMAVVLALVGCGGAMPSATTAGAVTPVPTSTAVSTAAPTSTLTPVPTLESTPTPAVLSASDIVESAIRNLRGQSSFSVTGVIEDGAVITKINADVVPPDKGYVHEHWVSGIAQSADEFLFIDDSRYARPPGFQVWFDYSGTTWSRRTTRDFPYDLGILAKELGNLEMQSSEAIETGPIYRITGTATRRLDKAMGFNVGSRSGGGGSEVEIWISRDDILPLRIEARFEERGEYFEAEYSEFGSEVTVAAPAEVLDLDYLQRLLDGTLNAEEKGLMVQMFPPEGQKCVEEEIGAGHYQDLVSGTSDLDSAFLWVLDYCEWPIFSFADDFARSSISQILYSLDLTVLTIPRGDMGGGLAQCVRESVGLEPLFEVGWGERAPTPEELAAAEECKAIAGEGEDS